MARWAGKCPLRSWLQGASGNKYGSSVAKEEGVESSWDRAVVSATD